MDLFSIAGNLELGLILGIMALGVYISFRLLDFPDLTVDGSFPLGACVAAVCINHGCDPVLATLFAVCGGIVAGLITALLHVYCGVLPLLASIITMTGLYSVNLRITGTPNVSLMGQKTLMTELAQYIPKLPPYWVTVVLCLAACFGVIIALSFLWSTDFGLSILATGENPQMSGAMGINTRQTIMIGMALSNGMIALSGALYSQAQQNANVGMGTGMIIGGLIAVVVGESIFKGSYSMITRMISIVFASILFRFVVGFALSLDTGDSFWSLRSSDLNLVTASIVAGFLIWPKIKQLPILRRRII